jgi:hypothetical protein
LGRKTNGIPEGKERKGKRAAKGSVRSLGERGAKMEIGKTGESLLGRETKESRRVNCDKNERE